jgi:triosephosphate isomerase
MTATNKKPFLAGNWKMFKTIPEALDTAQALLESLPESPDAEIVLIPPFTSLYSLFNILKDSPIRLGSQNIFWEDSGAFTGEISPVMLKDSGCTYAVIGHSERRQYFGETNATVNKKIKAALAHKIYPILCIGESLEEREKNRTIEKVDTQIDEGLEGFEPEEFRSLIIAYEPIWAIGTGLTATPEQAQEVHGYIRNKLAKMYGNDVSSCAIILYGGSVKPDNTFSLLKEKDINGALVGGASLKADSFAEIIKEGKRAYREK